MSERRVRIATTVAALLTFLLLAGIAHASGTYTGRPARPPSSVDRADYELGKKVFTGEFVASDRTGSAEVQSTELADLQSRLPRRARAGTDLTQLAGRLSDDQMRALRHYLSRRYRVH